MRPSQRVFVDGRFLTQPLTGVQRYASQIVLRLPWLRILAPGLPRLEYAAIPCAQMRVVRPPVPPVAWEQLVLPLMTGRDDVLWSPGGVGPLRSGRHVLTIHDLAVIEQPQCYGRAARLYYGSLFPAAARKARAIIAVSEFTKQRVVRLFDVMPERVHVVHHGVSDVFRPRSTDEITAVLERLGIDQPYFLAVGSVSPRKNFTRLLATWSHLRDLNETHSLVIVGRTDHLFSGNGRIETTSVSTKHVVSVSDPDLAALYSGALAFVYPSIYEGFGLPLLEAMACGAPVIASNAAAIPEVVGNAAMLVDPYDVDRIAATMRCIALDAALRDELRNRGLIRSRLFSWDKAAEQTWSVLGAAAA